MTNILVTGSRVWKNKKLLHATLRAEIKPGDVIIHGGAQGVDNYTRKFCIKHNIKTIVIRPLNPSQAQSYLQRNAEMIGMVERVLAFHDGKSSGTGFTISYAQKRGLPVKITESQAL